jgi:predicted TIM-barrel fold metal-dependent hydrolase
MNPISLNDYMNEPILKKTKMGVPLSDLVIVDSHAHLGHWHYMHIPPSGEKTMVRVMDKTGIKRAIISANIAIGPDYRMGNEMVYQAASVFPDKFHGYVTINPHYYRSINEELDYWFENKSNRDRMIAIKIHPTFHQYPIDGEYYRPVFQYAQAHDLVVLSHAWGESPYESLCGPRIFDKIAEKYPSVKIIVGHSGGNLPGFYKSVEVARKHENLYLDTCCSFLSLGFVEFLVENVGAERVIFSSDFPFLNAPAGLGKVVYSKIDTEEKQKILGLNAAKLFRLDDLVQ